MRYEHPQLLTRETCVHLCEQVSYDGMRQEIRFLEGTPAHRGTYWDIHWSLWHWAAGIIFGRKDSEHMLRLVEQKVKQHAHQNGWTSSPELAYQLNNVGAELYFACQVLADQGFPINHLRRLVDTSTCALEEALSIKRKWEDKHWLLSSLITLGTVYAFGNHPDEARKAYEEAKQLSIVLRVKQKQTQIERLLAFVDCQDRGRPWLTFSPCDQIDIQDGRQILHDLFTYLPSAFAKYSAMIGPSSVAMEEGGITTFLTRLTVKALTNSKPYEEDSWKREDPGTRSWNPAYSPGFIVAVPSNVALLDSQVSIRGQEVEHECYRQMTTLVMPESYPPGGPFPGPLGTSVDTLDGHFLLVCWDIKPDEQVSIRLRLGIQNMLNLYPENALLPEKVTAEKLCLGFFAPYKNTLWRTLTVHPPRGSNLEVSYQVVQHASTRVLPPKQNYVASASSSCAIPASAPADILRGGQLPIHNFSMVTLHLSTQSSPPGLLELLEDFKATVERGKFEAFWERRTPPKWKSRPEDIGHITLDSFLRGRMFEVEKLETYQEVKTGGGRIDLLVTDGSNRYIIEVKMLGHGYSLADVESGLGQLDQYLSHNKAAEGYLIIFDGSGGQHTLPSTYKLANGVVMLIAVNVNPSNPSKDHTKRLQPRST